jgi:hypothetical protein
MPLTKNKKFCLNRELDDVFRQLQAKFKHDREIAIEPLITTVTILKRLVDDHEHRLAILSGRLARLRTRRHH